MERGMNQRSISGASPCYGSNGKLAEVLPSVSSCPLLAHGNSFSSSPPILHQQWQQLCHGAPMVRRALSSEYHLEEEEEEAPVRVRRYNAGERRERIERYRSKRKRRNFQKKVTYACRKTLAAGRTRVRGRFARNHGDADVNVNAATEVSNSLMKNDIDQVQSNTTDGSSSGLPEWWPAMQEALAREEEFEEDAIAINLHLFHQQMLASSYLGVSSSANLYSYSDQSH